MVVWMYAAVESMVSLSLGYDDGSGGVRGKEQCAPGTIRRIDRTRTDLFPVSVPRLATPSEYVLTYLFPVDAASLRRISSPQQTCDETSRRSSDRPRTTSRS